MRRELQVKRKCFAETGKKKCGTAFQSVLAGLRSPVLLTIAQRFNAGFENKKIQSPFRDGRTARFPSVKTLGYYQEEQ